MSGSTDSVVAMVRDKTARSPLAAHVALWEQKLQHFPHKVAVDWFLVSMTEGGFVLGRNEQGGGVAIEARETGGRNLHSCAINMEEVDSWVERETKLGRLAGPFGSPKGWR